MTDKATILSWLEAERLSIADLLEDLSDTEWETRSLCPEWTIGQVAAHITTSTRDTLFGTVRDVIKARGNWDRMNATVAIERAAKFSREELIAQIRETAGSARRAPGAAVIDPLVDMLVHGQDIARPLGRARTMPLPQTAAALAHVAKSPFYGARKRFRGIKLVATDVDWTSGTGEEEIRGTASDLLLVATGRTAGLAGLSGSGAERVAAAL
ncbi:maleylpyruvate isomerase family mycothiol-dependent enzyme [Amycolatopsis sp. CA-230715]|uniref:maleylpyruvate isomerase family mycothiol-dependent enzyme n=1 Tax=Amycolatopsis sp. CA-230715 TaxID=2745196 RepID=UPI001C00D3A8|nr:maleylpyruvate isomerase family mycothiol-dependent enzyme [Amycolatopsis sp. CA-230715]QWF81997.1 hypothetical protein HUW46_05433 [Amycolatopsis sp. CA-230715]